MDIALDSPCFADAPVAAEVARGVTRLLCRQDVFAMCEVPLPNGRRADMMAIDSKGCLTIVEIKVARSDLLGDCKWTDYLDYCDRFYWAVPPSLAEILREDRLQQRADMLRPIVRRADDRDQRTTHQRMLIAGAIANRRDGTETSTVR